jgi:hypothetical protein
MYRRRLFALALAALASAGTSAVAADAPAPGQLPVASDAPPGRRVGGGTVYSNPPPAPTELGFVPRMRAHIEGPLSLGNPRVWVGPPVPDAVAVEVDGLELFLLDAADGGHLALYREPYGGKSCTLDAALNCRFLARFYPDGAASEAWSLPLNSVMSRRANLEVQDLRLADGVLYFNEACASYSKDARGKCSALVAWDAATQKVLWRTKPLTSNGRFLVAGDLLVAGYGFTKEKDWLFVVSRKDGRVVAKQRLKTAHETLTLDDDVLEVSLYSGDPVRFRLVGRDTKRPKLVPIR